MVTKLDRPVRREVRIGQTAYVVTLAPDRLRIAIKGRRKGQEVLWEDLVGAHDAPLAMTPQGRGDSGHERARHELAGREHAVHDKPVHDAVGASLQRGA